MASEKILKFIEDIKALSVLELAELVDAIQEAYLIAKKNNKKYTPKKYRKDEESSK